MTTPFRSRIAKSAQTLEKHCAELTEGGSPFHCDVLIVGSGYGGAVAAARLSGTSVTTADGKRRECQVWVVERGVEHLPGEFPSRLSEMPGHVRYSLQDGQPARGRLEGLFDVRMGTDVAALVANGLGGGSLINAGVMVRPDAAVFASASGWPAQMGGSLDAAFERAMQVLRPQQVPDPRRFSKRRVLDAIAADQAQDEEATAASCALTVNFIAHGRSIAHVPMRDCSFCGDCMSGCNRGAKGSLDTNYLALAHQRDAQIFTGVAVASLQPLDGTTGAHGWQVNWHCTDPQMRPPAGATTIALRAARVVLAAGSLGSTEILLRSRKLHELQVAGPLGKRFSTNGDTLAAGVGHKARVNACAFAEDDPFDEAVRRVGPTITGMVKVPAAGGAPAFLMEEMAVPAALRNVFGEVSATLLQLRRSSLPIAGNDPSRDPLALDDAWIDRTSLYGFMGDDGAGGELVSAQDPLCRLGDTGLRIAWPGDKADPRLPLAEAQITWLNTRLRGVLAKEAGLPPDAAATVLNGVRPALPASGERVPAVTVHPLGGCPMGDDASTGVVDDVGRVFLGTGAGAKAEDTLVVLDGSIIPCALGVNPALTIAALAERAVEQLTTIWAFDKGAADLEQASDTRSDADTDADVAQGTANDPPPRRRELPPPYAVWILKERLQGRLGKHWAELDIEYAPIPGFRTALSLGRREAPIRQARLRLWDAPDGGDGLPVRSTTAKPCCEALLSGTVHLFAPSAPDPDRNESSFRTVGIHYRMAVQSVASSASDIIAVGSTLRASKTIGEDPTQPGRSILSQLAQARMHYNGVPLDGPDWSIDMNDLVDRESPVAQLTQLSSMPDAIDDLAALGLYVLRRSMLTEPGPLAVCPKPRGRSIHAPAGCCMEPFELDGRRSLFRFRDANSAAQAAAQPTPILLIHGLGMSGATFTHAVSDKENSSIVRQLIDANFDPWVLDLRSSIINEAGRRDPASALWTVEEIGNKDIPEAIGVMLKVTARQQVDVMAHCMGAVMFCLAALGSHALEGKIRRAVLSQVGPLVRLAPLNRLRAFLVGFARHNLEALEFDTHPGWTAQGGYGGDGAAIDWKEAVIGLREMVGDALAANFPYSDAEIKAQKTCIDEGGGGLTAKDFLAIRKRADAMFGQLFLCEQMHPALLAKLDQLIGWVKAPMLGQALHFARLNMLTDARGIPALRDRPALNRRFGFPVLMVHGQRNAVFDWRGSFESLRLLQGARGHARSKAEIDPKADASCFGMNTNARLLLLRKHGHLDSLLGSESPLLHHAIGFLHEEMDAPPATASATPANLDFEEPWIGPMLGWLGRTSPPKDRPCYELRLLLRPSPRQQVTTGLCFIPVRYEAGVARPLASRAALLPWDDRFVTAEGLQLTLDANVLDQDFDSVAVVTVHTDLDLPEIVDSDAVALGIGQRGFGGGGDGGGSGGSLFRVEFDLPTSSRRKRFRDMTPIDLSLGGHASIRLEPERALRSYEWLAGGRSAARLVEAAVAFLENDGRPRYAHCVFRLSADVRKAANTTQAVGASELRFAVASCQNPAGMVDAAADDSYQALEAMVQQADGPQFGLLIGDQVYVDEMAGLFEPVGAPAAAAGALRDDDLDRIYEHAWRLPGLRASAARMPMMTLPDDHEIRNNWTPSDPEVPDVLTAMRAYERFQGALNPRARTDFGYRLSPAGVPFLMLDTRIQRAPRDVASIQKAQILHPDAVAALKDALRRAPEGVAKFIVSASPLLPPERFPADAPEARLRSDTWAGYPRSLADLLCFIRDENIRRVVVISGDSHLSSVSEFAFKGSGNKVVSVVCSGSYTPWPFVNQQPDELILSGAVDLGDATSGPVAGTVTLKAMSTDWGFGLIDLEADPPGDRHVALRVRFLSPRSSPISCVCRLDDAGKQAGQ